MIARSKLHPLMKPAGLFLFLTVGFVAVAFSSETSHELLTRVTKSRIRDGLPTYQAPPLKSASETTDLSPATDQMSSSYPNSR